MKINLSFCIVYELYLYEYLSFLTVITIYNIITSVLCFRYFDVGLDTLLLTQCNMRVRQGLYVSVIITLKSFQYIKLIIKIKTVRSKAMKQLNYLVIYL